MEQRKLLLLLPRWLRKTFFLVLKPGKLNFLSFVFKRFFLSFADSLLQVCWTNQLHKFFFDSFRFVLPICSWAFAKTGNITPYDINGSCEITQ